MGATDSAQILNPLSSRRYTISCHLSKKYLFIFALNVDALPKQDSVCLPSLVIRVHPSRTPYNSVVGGPKVRRGLHRRARVSVIPYLLPEPQPMASVNALECCMPRYYRYRYYLCAYCSGLLYPRQYSK